MKKTLLSLTIIFCLGALAWAQGSRTDLFDVKKSQEELEIMKRITMPSQVQTKPVLNAEQAKAFAQMPHEVLTVLLGSDPAIMRQALDTIDTKFGGPIELAKSSYGLTDAKISYLRTVYLS